uniref:Uncharacterized protein n=1 Tax=Rhizochromulina marina TaxID=1034831 RepID=A0A7S2RW37_9STRA|mmetsp:Transcript_21818/g.63482  ORF Transcript_21818/g.63482 Transcript_21818/m.63482 type:complete len:230 (+) Transcript_21818:147-836(+)
MGNRVASLTVDGFSVAPALEGWGDALMALVAPFLALLGRYQPPLSLRVRHAAEALPPDERRAMLEDLESSRHELSNSITCLEEKLDQVRSSEQAFEAKIQAIEGERQECEEAMGQYKARDANPPRATPTQETSPQGGNLERLRWSLNVQLPQVQAELSGELVSLKRSRAALETKLEELVAQRDELQSTIDGLGELQDGEDVDKLNDAEEAPPTAEAGAGAAAGEQKEGF